MRTIRGRTDNETQVKIMRQQKKKKKWKAGKQGIGSKGAEQPTADETFQNKTGNPKKKQTVTSSSSSSSVMEEGVGVG